MVEALASGKPVIALGRGGVLDIVPTVDPIGGILFAEPSEKHLKAALARFEALEKDIDPIALARSSRRPGIRQIGAGGPLPLDQDSGKLCSPIATARKWSRAPV
jgi:glycosyltransferase involved in cell wall biosynthesis